MITLLKRKDSYTPKWEERADNYQNHFIASIWYDGEDYFCFERNRGTTNDNFLDIYISKELKSFNFDNEYVDSDKSLLLSDELSLKDYNVLLLDKELLEKYLIGLKAKMKEKYKNELSNYNELLEHIKKVTKIYYFNYNLTKEIRRLFRTVNYIERGK